MTDKPSDEVTIDEKTDLAENHPAEDEGPDDLPESREHSSREMDVHLPLGKALTAREASNITAASRTRLIVLAGAVGSGKTTLIASIFHCFQKTSFAGYYFAGSDTLIGFDERSYLARIAPEREIATTKRTIPGTDRYLLHLRVRTSGLTEPARDLLFADLSGEDYEEFKDSPDECRRFGMIARADHFVLLVDGGKLIDLAARQGARNDVGMLLQSCVESRQLGRGSQVDIVISKWDLVEMSDDKPTHMTFVDDMKKWLTQRFAPEFQRLRFFEVVARREKGEYAVGYGLAEPFKSWVRDLPMATAFDSQERALQGAACEFDRYLDRWVRRNSVKA